MTGPRSQADPLTGLPNRPTIVGIVEDELRRRKTGPNPLTVILLDVNDFGAVNRSYGHLGGDEVLRQLANLLAATIRPGEHVGRFGGDLFMVVAPETDPQQAALLGEHLRSAVDQATFRYDGSEIKLTVRLGIAVAEAETNPPFEQVRDAASVAMDKDRSKRRGP